VSTVQQAFARRAIHEYGDPFERARIEAIVEQEYRS
jgi:hypothetical protein